jgi:Uma2 family endonuclease
MSSVINGHIETESPRPKLPETMTYEQFLEWPHENRHVEWVHGKVVPMAPIADEHADLTGWLAALLRIWVEGRALGVVRTEPVNMKTGPDLPGRSPDILYLSNANMARKKKTFIDGPADLTIEVISPDSRDRDRKEKFHEYEQGGVSEYWVIDPERRQVDFYQRGGNGIYVSAMPSLEGIYQSSVLPGLWLKVDWLWQKPLPSVISVLQEWKLI